MVSWRGVSDTLKFRMIAIAICVHMGIWFVAVLASSVTAVNVILDSLDEELEHQIEFVDFSSQLFIATIASLGQPMDEGMALRSIDLTEQIDWKGNPMAYWTIDGKLIYKTANAPLFPPPTAPGFFDETVMHNGEEARWRVLYRPLNDVFWVAVGVDTRESRQAIVRVGIKALYPMILIIPLTIAGIYLGTARGLRPIARVAAAVESRSPTSLEPLDTAGIHQELRPMLDSLNGLMGKLSGALENEHRFTANAAHELQTPLTAIKAELQMHQRSVSDAQTREILDSIGSRVDRAVYTVRQLLTLARLESLDASLPMSEVDLHSVAEQALADCAHLAMERSLELVFPEDGPWMVRGQRESLLILVGNLLANAFRYTPAEGRVHIAAQATEDGLVFSVGNDCEPMSRREMGMLVDRFYRKPGTDSAGAGLGLSIVQRIVEVHGAQLSLSPWEEDRGLLVSVRFAT